MLCVGLDPKSDINQISSFIAENGTNLGSLLDSYSTPQSNPNSTLPSPRNGLAEDSVHSSARTNGNAAKPKLLDAVINAMKGEGQLVVTTPTLAMFVTGCHAILQFTGSKMVVPDSLVESGECHVTRVN